MAIQSAVRCRPSRGGIVPYCLGCATDYARAEGINSPPDVDSDNLDTELTLGGGGIPVRHQTSRPGGARLVLLDEPLPAHLSRSHSTHLSISVTKYGAYSEPNMVKHNNTEDGAQNEEQPAWKNVNRDRGILTQEDRKYLLGKKEVSGQDERNTRYRIRQRFINSILDIGFIHKLEEDDKHQIMSDERLLDGSVRLSSASLLALLARYEHLDDLNETESEIESVLQEALTIIPSDEALKLRSGEPEQVRLTEVVGTVSIELKVAEPDIEKYIAKALGYKTPKYSKYLAEDNSDKS